MTPNSTWSLTIRLIFLCIPLGMAYGDNDLQVLKSRYEDERGKVVKECADRLSAQADQYLKSLQELQKALNEKSDATGALAVLAEIERFEKERKVYQEMSEATLLVLHNVEKANEREIASLKTEQARSLKETAKLTTENNAPPKMENCALGAEVTASSTHFGESGENTPAALVDGDLFTRWSSDYSEPQEVVLHLKKPMILNKLRLHWEKASATKYCVYLSSDGKNWTSVYLYMNIGSGEPASRVDEVDLKNTPASWVKLDLQSCINTQWGFSLYEIEVMGSGITAQLR